MIILSGVLVVAAIALLVAGIVAGNGESAQVLGLDALVVIYVSIAVSVVSALCLAIGVFLRRKELFGTGASTAATRGARTRQPGRAKGKKKADRPSSAAARGKGAAVDDDAVEIPTQPVEVPGDTVVYVVRGRRRYHLDTCRQLAGRQTEELTYIEAQEEGFSPCTACLPDTALAARAAVAVPADRTASRAATETAPQTPQSPQTAKTSETSEATKTAEAPVPAQVDTPPQAPARQAPPSGPPAETRPPAAPALPTTPAAPSAPSAPPSPAAPEPPSPAPAADVPAPDVPGPDFSRPTSGADPQGPDPRDSGAHGSQASAYAPEPAPPVEHARPPGFGSDPLDAGSPLSAFSPGVQPSPAAEPERHESGPGHAPSAPVPSAWPTPRPSATPPESVTGHPLSGPSEYEPRAAAPGTPAEAAPLSGAPGDGGVPAASGGGDILVRILSGTKRYHRVDCGLIEDIGDEAEDLESLSRAEAKARGCTPCLVCQPDRDNDR